MLNNAKDELEDFFDWPWLETTTTGTAPLTVTNLKRILYVTDTTNDTELPGVQAADINANIADTGTPCVWWLDGSTVSGNDTTVIVNVYPVSAVSLSIRHTRYSANLVADSESPLIPVRYHRTWVDLAAVEAYKDSDNFEAAAALRADVDRRLGQMIETLGARNKQNSDYQVVSSESILFGDW